MTYIVGTPDSDRLDGTAGDDLIEGLGNADWIEGLDGADTLHGGEGDDYLAGGAGDDTLSSGGGDDFLDGGDGDDVLLVDIGQHTIHGGAGNDRIEVYGGVFIYDTDIWGWMGEGIDDVVLDYSDYAGDLFIDWSGSPSSGTKTVNVAGGVLGATVMVELREVERMSSVVTGIGDDTVYLISPDATVFTGAGDDHVVSLNWQGFGWITLGGSVDGGEGIDRVQLNWSDLGPGQSVVYDSADPAGTVVATQAGDRFLLGIEVLETFHSGQGADRLTVHSTGLAGVSQSVHSEGGDDVVTVVAGAEPLGDHFNAYLGGQAEDHLIVDFRASTVGALAAGGYHEQGGQIFLNGYDYGRRTILGSDHGDVFGDGDGAATNDVFLGGGGDDVLSAAKGVDEAHGGAGTDRLEVQLYSASALDGVYFVAAATPSSDGLGGFEGAVSLDGGSVRYTSIENFTVHGTGGADHIVTGDGDDILDGGPSGPGDTLEGGSGDDLYFVDSLADVVSERDAEGTDEVRTELATYVLAANVETLTAASDSRHDFRGNSGNNLITGGGGNDNLRLQDGGDDRVLGGEGADNIFMIGSLTAADVLDGGAGNDTLILQGNYAGGLTLTANVTNIELISILAGSNTNFGEPGTNRHDYVLTVNDSNFSGAIQVRVNGSALLADEDFVFDGSAELDSRFVVYGGRGVDTLTGSRNNDIFFLAEERFATGDTVNGGAGYDGMFLRGNYTIDFNAPGYTGLFTNIENLTLTSATDERYARGGGTEFDYNLTLSDAIVKPGETLTISGALLMASETMVLDGSAETDGKLSLFGGKADDTLKGGGLSDILYGNLGADQLAGNGGADVFRYQAVAESDGASMDRILDFAAGTDKVDLSRIDADSNVAGNQGFTWIGSNAFSGSAGQLRAYQDGSSWFVEGDTNGDSVADLVIRLDVTGGPLGQGDFLP